MTDAQKPAPNVLVITRIFDAPRALVWKAWTDPKELMKWHGPNGYTSPTYTIDLRVGGRYHGCMRSAEGQEHWSTGVYKEIVPMRKIVCTDSFADEKGNVISAKQLGLPGEWPMELLVTVTFEDHEGNKTKLTIRHEGMPTDIGDMASAGWNESLDKLAAVLS